MGRAAMLLLLGVLAACGSGVREAAERRSYEATARYVIDAWREGRLPARYAADTLRTIAEELHDRRLAGSTASWRRSAWGWARA